MVVESPEFVLVEPQYCPTCQTITNGEWHSIDPWSVPKYWKCHTCLVAKEFE